MSDVTLVYRIILIEEPVWNLRVKLAKDNLNLA